MDKRGLYSLERCSVRRQLLRPLRTRERRKATTIKERGLTANRTEVQVPEHLRPSGAPAVQRFVELVFQHFDQGLDAGEFHADDRVESVNDVRRVSDQMPLFPAATLPGLNGVSVAVFPLRFTLRRANTRTDG